MLKEYPEVLKDMETAIKTKYGFRKKITGDEEGNDLSLEGISPNNPFYKKNKTNVPVQKNKSVTSIISDVVFPPAMANDMVNNNFENVDIDFIVGKEGFELQGKVPDAKNSKSGVTISSGFDLGARNLNDLKGLPKNIITKLKPFLGLKGSEAVAKAKELNITEEEAEIINTFAHKQSLSKLKRNGKKILDNLLIYFLKNKLQY